MARASHRFSPAGVRRGTNGVDASATAAFTRIDAACAVLLCAFQLCPAARADELPEITVTATRSEHSSFDVPAAVTSVIVNADDDAKLGVNASEALNQVPGVLARDRQNYAQDEQISIRGFGARATFGVRSVRLYVDGIPATFPDGQGQVSHFNLPSAARIEVLRGPFSALYGNSSGGVIEIFTADGADPAQFGISAVGASYGSWRADANARDHTGALNYNVDLSHFYTDGYRPHSAAERDSGNAKLRVDLGYGRTLTLVANTLALPQAQDPLGLTPAQFRADPRQTAPAALQFDTRKTVHQEQAGAIFDAPFGDAQNLHALVYAGQRNVDQFQAIAVASQSNPLHPGGVVDLDAAFAGLDARWTWRGELAAQPFEITAGVSYDDEDQQRRGFQNFVGATLGVTGALRRDETDKVRNADGYAQATWRISERWSIDAGLRHDDVQFDSRDHYVTTKNPDDSGHVAYAATTPVAGVLFRASETLHLYAAYGRGFETPTFNELGYRSDGGAGLNFALQAARSDNVEIGAKWRPGKDIEMDFALFQADTRDELAVATSVGGRSTYRNLGRARRSGAEFGGRWQLAPRWRAQLAYTYLDATFRSPFLACAAANPTCTKPTIAVPAGARIPGVPAADFFASLRYGSDAGWFAAIEASAVSKVATNDLASVFAPGYALAGINGGYLTQIGGVRAKLFARLDNAFDRHYVGSVIVNDGNGRYFEPGPGRNALAGVELRW